MTSRLTKLMFAAALAATAARADFIDLWANKIDMPTNKAPRVGRSRVLVIPVQIDYVGAKGALPAIDLDAVKAFFTAPGSDEVFNFNGFFRISSLSRFQPEAVVAPLVQYNGCPVMLARNADCTIARGNVSALRDGLDFLRDVFRRSHDENKVDFAAFDINGLGGQPDGVIDGVIMLVNVPRTGIAFPIEYVNSGSNLNGGNGGPFVLDGIRIPYVAVGGTSTAKGKIRNELVALHEFGHVLGMADLYYEHPSSGDPYPNWQGFHFSLMGDYGYDEKATLPDAESRRALGWQSIHVVTGHERITLAPAAAGGGAVKLGMMEGGRKEYFLAEVRGKNGAYDDVVDGQGKQISGLAVYHIDWARGPKTEMGAWVQRLLTCLDCDPFHPFIRNLESSNQWGLVFAGPQRDAPEGGKVGIADDRVLFMGGHLESIPNAGQLSRTNRYTATNWYDGSESGIRIEDIRVNVDGSVTATFVAPYVNDPCADVTCAPLEMCVQGGIHAGNCAPIQAPTPAADGGFPDAGGVQPLPTASGCATGSSAPAFALLPLLLVAALLVRRRRA